MQNPHLQGRNILVVIAIAALILLVLTNQRAIWAYQSPGNTVATVSAATFKPQVAPDSVATSFGQGLATGTQIASTIPLPTSLLGTTIMVRDAQGDARLAPLLFVSPGQINHLIPSGTSSGTATVTVQSGNGQTSTGTIQVAQVAPGIFTANQSGDGVPAASALRVRNSAQNSEPITMAVDGRFLARPIDLGPDTDRVFLILFLTGLRNAPNSDGNSQNGSAENVRVLIGGALQTSIFAGPQGTFAGLDQVNVEIPRPLVDPTIAGSRNINLSVKVPGFTDSNEVEIALAPVSGAPLAINSVESAASVLANSQIRINASGISPIASNNRVSFGEGSGDVRPGEVIAATPTQLTVQVPFGANAGRITLNSNGNTGTSEQPLPVRTSLSATLRDTDGQPLSPAFGARVCFPNCSAGNQITTVQPGGWFVLPDPPAGNRRIFVIETQSQNGSLNFNRTTVSSQVVADRDNQLPQQVYLQAISGPSAVIGSPGFAPSNNSNPDQARQITLSIDDFTFMLPANAKATFPDGSKSGAVTLTPVKNSLTPVPLPPGIFSSAIVQLTPFGTRLGPGGKLTFPNRDNLPGFPLPSLYKYDTNSANFIDTGVKVLPTDDRRFFSTPEGAITETSIYFIALPRQTTTIIGRVLESDSKPVRGAIVTARGHNAVTDGNGGYTLAEIPTGEFESFNLASVNSVRTQTGLIVTSNYLRPSGRSDTVMQVVQNPTIGGVTDLPPFMLPSVNTNRPPTVTVPQFVPIYANETQNLQVIVAELDAGQSISNVSVTGAEFAALSNQGNGSYTLQLTPKIADVGMRTLTVTAADSAGAMTTATISLTVYPLPTANTQMLQVAAGAPLPITLTGSDAGGLPLTYTIVIPPTRGTLTGTPPAVTYNAQGGGNDSFTFKVSNGIVESLPATVTIAVTNLMPALSSLVPDSTTVNSTVQLRVIGQRFVSSSVIFFNGAAKLTTFVSATELTTTLAATDVAQAGTVQVVVTNPAPGGGTSNQLPFIIRNPLPILSTLLPDSTTTNNGTFELRVLGNSFVPGAVISFNGQAKQTSFITATELTATINGSDIAQAGMAQVAVVNPAPGGGTSNEMTFFIRNQEPVINAINPTSVIAGGPAFTLTVSGSGFTPDSVVNLNGAPRDTAFFGQSELRAMITSSDIAAASLANITVFTPAPGGGQSAPQVLTINNPGPTIISIDPTTAIAGGADFILQVNGTNYNASTVLRVNGSPRTTTFVNSGQVTATITAADIAAVGFIDIAVINPPPGGGGAGVEKALIIKYPDLTLTSINPTSITAGGPDFVLEANGTNFNTATRILFNGIRLGVTLVNSGQMTTTINAGLFTTAGLYQIAAENPFPFGGPSSPLIFMVLNPAPMLTSINPTSVNVGGPGFVLQANGTNFNNSSIIHFNGAERATTFVNSGQITAAITASDLAQVSTAIVTVVNPAPGGGVSNQVPFAIDNPAPSLTQLTPATIIREAPPIPVIITLTGTGFVPNSQATLEGSDRATTFVSQTQLKMEVLPSDQEILFNKSVRVINPSPGGGMSNDIGLSIENPVPTLTSIQPDTLTAYSNPSGLYTITGTGFTSETAFFVGAGSPRGINFINSTTATAQIFSGDAVPAGIKTVRVSNAPPGGGGSNLLQITVNVPQPEIGFINPPSTPANGGVPVQVTVTGTNFIPTSQISLNGNSMTTTYNSANELTFMFPPGMLITNLDYTVRVTNPGPMPKIAEFSFFTVEANVPVFNDRSPSSVIENSGDFTISVTNGAEYTTRTQLFYIQDLGSGPQALGLNTSYGGSTALMAAVPGSLIQDIPGLGSEETFNVNLVLNTPEPVVGSGMGSGLSGFLPFTINGVDPGFNLESRSPIDEAPSRARMQEGLLADGRLITTGGRNGDGQGSTYAIMSMAETFDPSTKLWTRIANMIFPREDHSLMVLGSGVYDNRYAGEAIVIGGRGLKSIEDRAVPASRTAERYDLSTNTWRRLADLEFPHIQHSVTRLNGGRLLVVGGMDEKGQVNAAVELYDPNDDRWTTVASPVHARAGHSAILLDDGRVAIFGGSNETGALTSVEIYDPQTNLWSDGGHLLHARVGHTLILLNDGHVLIVGGESSGARDSAEIYDPRTRQSSYIAPPLRKGVGR